MVFSFIVHLDKWWFPWEWRILNVNKKWSFRKRWKDAERCDVFKNVSIGMVAGVMYNPTTGLQSTVAQWEAVCDHYFLPCSHGFRKGYSQQTCLKQIRRDFGGTIWYIEGKKLAKLFGSIDLRAVLQLLQQKIRAEDLDVVYNGVRISLLESPKKGITKEGFAPLGCNVVLHELDQFVMRLKRIVDRGTRMPMSPALKVVNTNSAALDTELITNPRERPILRDPPDHFLRRINYSRFADGFLIGVIGPRNLAVKIRDLVIKFLQVRLKLKLDPDNIPISRAFDTKVPFLGYLISRHPDRIQKVVLRHAGKCRTFRVHMSGGLCLLVDTQTVIRRLAEKGFCDKAGNPKPNFRYYQYPQARSVAAVASIIRGLADYYHLANSKLRFISRVTYVLRSSLAKTYAAKFKLRSSAKVYKRGGRDLSKPIKVNKDSGSKTHLFGERNSRYPAAIPYTRSRQIPRPDTKKLGKDWLPRRRRPVSRSWKPQLSKALWAHVKNDQCKFFHHWFLGPAACIACTQFLHHRLIFKVPCCGNCNFHDNSFYFDESTDWSRNGTQPL